MSSLLGKGKHQAPARGALAGVRADFKQSKDGTHDDHPNAVGSAWTHNFLNQKPWHPLSFRNRAKVFEHEQQHLSNERKREETKAEFESEQQYLQTLSFLSADEQKKYRERQSVSWLYMKPPGLDEKKVGDTQDKDKQRDAGAAGPSGQGEGNQENDQRRRNTRPSQGYIKNVLGGIAAVQNNENWELKHVSGTGGRSPPRGGIDPTAENQQFVVSDDDQQLVAEPIEAAGPSGADAGVLGSSVDMQGLNKKERRRLEKAYVAIAKAQERDSKRQKVSQAEQYLKAVGVEALMHHLAGKEQDTHKSKSHKGSKSHKHKSHKSKKSQKHEAEHQGRRDRENATDCDSDGGKY